MKSFVTLIVVAVTSSALASMTFANDQLVWDNGDMYVEPNGAVSIFLGSQVTDTGTDNAIADDFMLIQDTFVTSIQWTGAQWSAGFPDAFIIEFYASDPSGTTPTNGVDDPSKTALASYTIQSADIDAVETDIWPGADPFFHITAEFPTPFVAISDELYWVSIQSYFKFPTHFGWLQSELSQLNPIATSFGGPWATFDFEDNFAGDMTFKLFGTPVPAPGMLAFLGVAAIATRRRVRK